MLELDKFGGVDEDSSSMMKNLTGLKMDDLLEYYDKLKEKNINKLKKWNHEHFGTFKNIKTNWE